MPFLSDATKVYLGDSGVQKIYLGTEEVWSGQWLPTELSGLSIWYDASQINTTPTIGSDERMLANTAPASQTGGDYTLGCRFTPNAGGQVSHIRYWNAAGTTHTVSLWKADGTKLSSAVDSGATVGGWREVALPSPVAVSAGATYCASFSADGFAIGYTTQTMPASLAPHLAFGSDGYYASGADVFPSSGAGGSHYHVDVVYQTVVYPTLNPWPDLSGKGNHGAIVGTPDPVVQPNILNGLPVVRFKANEGRVRATNIGITHAHTLVYVSRMLGPAAGRIATASYPNPNFLIGWWNYKMDVAYSTSGAFFQPDPNKNWNAEGAPSPWIMYSSDGAAHPSYYPRMFRNGVLVSSGGSDGNGGPGDAWGNTFNLSGYSATGPEETCDCEVAEAVLYDRKLSDAERQQVEQYMRDKWGL